MTEPTTEDIDYWKKKTEEKQAKIYVLESENERLANSCKSKHATLLLMLEVVEKMCEKHIEELRQEYVRGIDKYQGHWG